MVNVKTMKLRIWTSFVTICAVCACLSVHAVFAEPYAQLTDMAIDPFTKESFTFKYSIRVINMTSIPRLYVVRPWKEAKLGEGYSNATFNGYIFRVETGLDNTSVYEHFPYLEVKSTFYWASTLNIISYTTQATMASATYEASVSVQPIDKDTFKKEALDPMNWNGDSMIYNFAYRVTCDAQIRHELISDFQQRNSLCITIGIILLAVVSFFSIIFYFAFKGKKERKKGLQTYVIAEPFATFSATAALMYYFNASGPIQPPFSYPTNILLIAELIVLAVMYPSMITWRWRRP
jgi:hypothetical protein